MIQHESILLASFPAGVAILLEVFNPLSETFVRRQAGEAVAARHLAPNSPDVLATFGFGAASVAGLAPTALSVLTAALALLHDLPGPEVFWWLYGVFVVMVLILLFMSR